MDVRELDPIKAAALNVLLMVHELHKLGYQRLRIVPGMSPSQAYWRVTILPRSRILRSHGAMSHDWAWGGPEPFFTSGQEGRRGGSGFSDTGISGFQAGHRRDRRHEVHEEA